uniref:uncharacterized protein LOC122772362 isoform X4 n=1 Tax=Solea senegalensis TaxID=28829 RepID=UPI001CD880EE|nr:uncharacterized protein LOC122772362 isoform X4 [Solea senegalensis]
MVKQQQTRSWIDTWTWRCTPQIWTEAWVLTSWPHSSESIRNHPFRNECNNRWKRCRHDDSHRHHHSSASASLSPVFTCGLIFILMYLEFHWMLMTMTLVRQQFQVSPCRLSIRAPLSPHTWTTE